MFATKSSYETNRGHHIDPTVSSCTPSKFWFLSRHGTRLPSKSDLENIFTYSENIHQGIVNNYEAGRTSLCASDYTLIKNWKFDPNITIEIEQFLTVAGWNELQGIAQRYKAAFPSIFPTTYSPNDYFFRTTYKQRTLASLRGFADGLFGLNGFERVEFADVPDPDLLLRPYDNCPLYDEISEDSNEQDAFKEGPEYQEMLTQVSSKLGFSGSSHLRATEIETLANICKYEQIWNINGTSPMCAAFSVANHQVLEYTEDLDYFYKAGYGHKSHRRLYENLSCHLMQNLLSFLQSTAPNDHKARIFSTHSTMLQLILVTFSAFDDENPLTRHNFAQQTWRLWKSSLIAPKATNLVVIRFE